MARIKGYYEWDDENLTPGQKKEGGLHQNLFDSEGNLKGSARFVPDESDDLLDFEYSQQIPVTSTVFVPHEQRGLTAEQREALEAIVSALIDYGISKGKPIVERWWRESARPVVDAQLARLARIRPRRKAKGLPEADVDSVGSDDEVVVEGRIGGTIDDLTAVRPVMSSAEAQARYLAALAAQAYSEEQLRLVQGADIVDYEGVDEVRDALAGIPRPQLEMLITAMVADPSMLSEGKLAQLASVLGRHALE